jgi:hypothetical protein
MTRFLPKHKLLILNNGEGHSIDIGGRVLRKARRRQVSKECIVDDRSDLADVDLIHQEAK